MDNLMNEYFETRSYDDEGDWRKTPETAHDPDDETYDPAEKTAKPR